MSDDNKPIVAAKEPFAIEVEAGKKYFWCTCGRSAKQPFCDGSHKDTGFTPLMGKQKAAARSIFAAAKQRTANHSAMVPTVNSSA